MASMGSMVGGTSHTLVSLQVPVTHDLLNGLGVVRIGELLKSMDIAACMSAERHSLSSSVTLSMDDVNFSDARAKPGDVVVIRSRVNRAFKSSMEVGLRVEIEVPETGLCRHLCSSYFVFVALDAEGKKVEVPPLTPLTDKEKVRWALAAERRQIRLDHAKIIQEVIKDNKGLRYSVSAPAHASGVRSSVVRFGESDDKKNEVTQMVLPQHANHYGNTFGGQVMCWAHEVAECAAARHARTPVITVSVDDMYFLAPSKVGTRVMLKASVNRVFNRSMEVGVRVEGHHLNGEIVIISRAYFTMVAVEPASPLSPQLLLSPLASQPIATSQVMPAISLPERKPSNTGGLFGRSKAKKQEASSAQPPPSVSQQQGLPRTESRLQPIRSVPLVTPDQIRRHQEALGRRRVRLERLQLKKSNHLAWPFTPDTNPRAFALENLKTLEKVTRESEIADSEQDPSIPMSPTLNRGTWGLVGVNDDIEVFSKASITHGVSMKSVCTINAPFDAVIFAVWDVGSRMRWDKAVVAMEIKHRFDHVSSDIAWLAIDVRAMNPTSKPTDFALLRSWKRQGDTFVIASHSVVHHSVPVSTSYVRAETGSAGFILREIEKNKIDVQYVLQLNQSGTSIVAGELVGQSKVYAMRMKGLAEYAQSLHPDVYADVNISRTVSNNGSIVTTTNGSSSSDQKNCSIM